IDLNSKINKIAIMKQKLKPLKNTECLYLCFGSGKLFKAQNNLVESGYKTLTEWGVDWGKNAQACFSL
ncbi:MAG: hypothetical protein O4808_18495, partial [Trichodesmium sp. St17_bin3_1_1]|nr:hypothetical protein [Trichodesmium sp. St17_bin3_1_1]